MDNSVSETFSGVRIAVSVILERREVQQGPWLSASWRWVGVMAAPADEGKALECTQIHADESSRRYLWSSLTLTLYRDSAESYWYNLVGENPSLYLICGQRSGHELAPLRVTANYGEAGAHMETDTKVFSTPLPPEVYRWLEAYVLANYVPREPFKRKREKWSRNDPAR